jgi:hypothetical protein
MKGAGCDTIFLVDWRYILVALRVGGIGCGLARLARADRHGY